ncbi:MAG TPA: asparaginase domain-containing protein [Woeseiaceae bacterium]
MFIRFLTTGGTIDKIYFDALGEDEVGESRVQHILGEGLAQFDFDVVSLFRKDSLDITAEDRQKIRSAIEDDSNSLFVVTHGTDTMVETAEALVGIAGKTIVLTGALSPARFRSTDAVFNIGLAVGAVQSLAPGVYIAMSGRVFQAGKVRKNRSRNRFEPIE